MKLTVLGGSGAWPTAAAGCSGYLIRHEGTTILIDPGYAIFPRMLEECRAGDIDAVLISHAHPDHCADLNPLLRARVLGDERPPVLPVYAPEGALQRILDLDPVRVVRRGIELNALADGGSVRIGPIRVRARTLPHHATNLGYRLEADGDVLAYTGDSGDCAARIELARDADVYLAEATYVDQVPGGDAPYLCTVRQVARQASIARPQLTVLTHLWPTASADHALATARAEGLESVQMARPGLTVDLARIGVASLPRRAAGEQVPPDAITALPRRARRL
ncbi:MBL fold metallo-hydrolase [Microlunatus parietis]|uniref:Ribonuclease BN (tRNA processing enzyme) n=1 Tax=Microlunatus parietis TaxID=682979 RepID=A0A7Y9I644_9ACTN|nr:MBL fold metallo-hydrolase [Microlunatus parietis]NYE70959.1 ribonuclease BN (tRNA processing enzyme) [Microlunatus parietis]